MLLLGPCGLNTEVSSWVYVCVHACVQVCVCMRVCVGKDGSGQALSPHALLFSPHVL